MIQYILEVIAFQLVFLIIYDFWLKRETFFQWNRAYLIGTYILSMVLPWVKIEALKTTVPEAYYAYPEFLWNINDMAATTVTETNAIGFAISWEYLLLFGGMFLASLFFANKLRQLYVLKKNGKIQRFSDFTQIIIANSQVAFSFFKSIFMGDKVLERDYKSVIEHELVHIKQGHTYDLLFFELMRIVCWFNPLVYVYQNRVAELHEFIADAHVAKTNKKEHYQLLLSQVFETHHISFINQFFKTSLIKKRIIMLQKSQSKKIWRLKYLLLLPLVLGMLLYSSLEAQESEIIQLEQTSDDSALIDSLTTKIEKEIKRLGSVEKVYRDFSSKNNDSSDEIILSKKAYFESRLLFEKHFTAYVDSLKKAKARFFRASSLHKIPLPSTAGYKSYIARKRAFQILDENLKLSITVNVNNEGLGIRLIEGKENYTDRNDIFEVDDVKDLTGNEVRFFNDKLEEIFVQKDTDKKGLVLKDAQYSFEIFETKPFDTNGQQIRPSMDMDEKNRYQKKYTELVRERKRLLQNASTDNPLIINLDKELRALKEKIAEDKIVQNEADDKYLGLSQEREEQEIETLPFSIVDQAPVFPGCEGAADKRACFQKSWLKHISDNFRYPKEAQDNGIQGRVNIMFTINEEGNIVDIRKRGPDKLLEDEAERIISLLPKMKAGIHKGKGVKVPFSMPISFKLTNEEVIEKSETKIEENENGDVPFAIIDEVPVFPGCETAVDKRACFRESMQEHISDNFKYPIKARKKGIQGRVSIMFTVGKDGVVGNIRKRGPDELLEKEAERIIKLLPVMTPGKQKGEPVNVPFSMPITFKL